MKDIPLSTDETAIVESAIRAAGWYERRTDADTVRRWSESLDTPTGFRMFPAAEEALSEYGGLEIHAEGAGRDVARTSVKLDPTLALGEEERFARFRAQVGEIYPLGEVGDGHAFLAMDRAGRVYLLLEDLQPLAPSIRQAIAALLLGARQR